MFARTYQRRLSTKLKGDPLEVAVSGRLHDDFSDLGGSGKSNLKPNSRVKQLCSDNLIDLVYMKRQVTLSH